MQNKLENYTHSNHNKKIPEINLSEKINKIAGGAQQIDNIICNKKTI
jgi:hypothetical protein